MQINPDFNTAAYTIRAYRTHEVDVYIPEQHETNPANEASTDIHEQETKNYTSLNHSFIVTPDKLIEDWEIENPHMLTETHFRQLLALKPEIVIVGTGKKIHFADQVYTLPLTQAGIGVEFMDTAAACRTYNFLVSDGRKVAAAIFMIKE